MVSTKAIAVDDGGGKIEFRERKDAAIPPKRPNSFVQNQQAAPETGKIRASARGPKHAYR